MSFPAKGSSLHHHDQHQLSFEVCIPLIMVGPVVTLAAEGAENSWMVLLAMIVLGGGRLRINAGLELSTKFIEEG